MAIYDFSVIPDFQPLSSDSEKKALRIRRALDILTHNRNHIPREVLISLEVNGVVLGTGGFVVAAFQPFGAEADDFPLIEVLLNMEALVAREFESNCVNYVCQMDNHVIALCGFPRLLPQDNRELQIMDLMSRLSQGIIRLCGDLVGLKVVAGISPLGFGPDTVAELFNCAAEALEYNQYIMNFNEIRCFPDKLDSMALLTESLSIEKAAFRFANLLYTKSFLSISDEAELFVHSLINSKSATKRDLHFSLLLFTNSFSSELLRLEVVDVPYLQKNNILGILYVAKNIADLIDVMSGIIHNIEAYYSKKTEARNNNILDRTRKYIAEHFKDTNLSVSRIADEMCLNETTLSNLFRTYYGQSIISYIRSHRVNWAKALLADSGISMEEVASQSGFGSINTLYRAFKRVEGIAPGRFRQG